MKMRTAQRTHGFTESVIREMTRVANEHGAINLAQGFPDFAAPAVLEEADQPPLDPDRLKAAFSGATRANGGALRLHGPGGGVK